jgi:hypothetical protein
VVKPLFVGGGEDLREVLVKILKFLLNLIEGGEEMPKKKEDKVVDEGGAIDKEASKEAVEPKIDLSKIPKKLRVGLK